jgi:hypothetical protein
MMLALIDFDVLYKFQNLKVEYLDHKLNQLRRREADFTI